MIEEYVKAAKGKHRFVAVGGLFKNI